MSEKTEEMTVSLKVKKVLVELVDSDRDKFKQTRSSWIIQAMVEKLERLGYELKKD